MTNTPIGDSVDHDLFHRAEHAAAETMRHLMHPHQHDPAAAEVTHLSPSPTSGIMPCCGKTPLEVPRTDRITTDRGLVTCHGAHAPTQTPAAAPVNLAAAAAAAPHQEETMSLATDLRNVADRVDRLGEEVVGKVETVVATPAGVAGLDLLHALTGLNIDQAIVTKALGGLEALLQAYAPDPAPAEPAAPVTAQ